MEVDPLDVPLPEDLDGDGEVEAEQTSEVTTLVESPAIDQYSAPKPTQSTSIYQLEPIAAPDVEASASLEQPLDTHCTLMSKPLAPSADLALPNDSTIHTLPPNASEPMTRSPTSPSPSEASKSDSDFELEECVDVESMTTSEDEDTELEDVERNVDL